MILWQQSDLAAFQELVIFLIGLKQSRVLKLVYESLVLSVLISQVVEKLEEENSMLKENIQLLEESTTVSCVKFFVSRFPCCFFDELSTLRINNKSILTPCTN